MDDETVQENPVPAKSEKEKSLEAIVSLGESIADARTSIKITSIVILIAAVGSMIAAINELESPYMLPILFILLGGNQVYISRTRNSQKKLEEMRKEHESKFGVVVSS